MYTVHESWEPSVHQLPFPFSRPLNRLISIPDNPLRSHLFKFNTISTATVCGDPALGLFPFALSPLLIDSSVCLHHIFASFFLNTSTHRYYPTYMPALYS